MKQIAIVDSSYFIYKKVPLNYQLITTDSVIGELKDIKSMKYYESIKSFFNIKIINKKRREEAEKLNMEYKLELSITDIDILSLAIEYKDVNIICLTDDNRLKNACKILNIEIFNEKNFKVFLHKFKCTVCSKIYDFPHKICKECGYSKIRRINLRSN